VDNFIGTAEEVAFALDNENTYMGELAENWFANQNAEKPVVVSDP